jgi:dihydroorotase-like cyclic amidohydrolase
MWRGLADGTIDYICSDHAPHPKSNKMAGWKNIWDSGNGNPGTETLLPTMLDRVNKGDLSLQRLAYHISARPAQVFKMYPKKGSLMVGTDADITVVDLDAEWTIDSEKMYSKSRETSMFDGWTVKGKPVLTVVRGEIVAEDGVVVGEEGYGSFQKRLS